MGYEIAYHRGDFAIEQDRIAAAAGALVSAGLVEDGDRPNDGVVIDALKECGFWAGPDDESGAIRIWGMNGSHVGNSWPDEVEVILEAIAPFVIDRSFLELSDDEHTVWRWAFAGGKVHRIYPEVTWPEID